MANSARQIYVVSDLHLGGTYPPPGGDVGTGFRLCSHVDHLTAFVNTLEKKPGPLELVINGDTVDFLAEKDANEPHWTPFTADQDAAVRKLDDIVSRDQQFFDALRSFLAAGHRLTVLLGNHDIELALPLVRARLEEILGADGTKDYRLISNGEAYIVGDALIEHGNRYDEWNTVDNDSLRRVCSLKSRRQAVPSEYEFDPPAGSVMVSSVINPIKEEYRFIDLLKPEDQAVVPLLLALEPGYRGRLAKAAKLRAKAYGHRLQEAAMPSYGGDISAQTNMSADEVFGGDMGGGDISAAAPPAAPVEPELEQALTNVMGEDARSFLKELDAAAPSKPADGYDDIGGDISAGETLENLVEKVERGFGLLRLSVGGGDFERRLELVHKALRALQNDQSFSRDTETVAAYIDSAKKLSEDGDFKYVLFGHTHLAKDIDMGNGARYLNSGTWSDLMKAPQEVIAGEGPPAQAKLREFAEALRSGQLNPWIQYEPTFIRMELGDDGRVKSAELCDYTGPESV